MKFKNIIGLLIYKNNNQYILFLFLWFHLILTKIFKLISWKFPLKSTINTCYGYILPFCDLSLILFVPIFSLTRPQLSPHLLTSWYDWCIFYPYTRPIQSSIKLIQKLFEQVSYHLKHLALVNYFYIRNKLYLKNCSN